MLVPGETTNLSSAETRAVGENPFNLEELDALEEEEKRRRVFDRSVQVDVNGMQERRRGNIEREENERDQVIGFINEIAKGSESIRSRTQRRRVEQYYGRGCLAKMDAYVSGMDTKGASTWQEELKRRGLKILGKTALTGAMGIAMGIGIGVLTGGGVAWGILGAGVAGGAVGRTAVEGIRFLRGSERKKKQEIEKADAAVEERIQELADFSIKRRIELEYEHIADFSYNVEKDPEYQKIIYELFDLLHDDSKRRVQVIINPMSGKEEYRAVTPGEEPVQNARVINVGEQLQGMRKEERGWEKIADITAMVTGAATAIATKVLYGAHHAAEAAKAITQHKIEALQRGRDLVYDFDKLKPAHLIHLFNHQQIVDGVKGSIDQVVLFSKGNGAWHVLDQAGSTLANVGAAINKVELARAMMNQIYALAGFGAGLIAQTFSRPALRQLRGIEKTEIRAEQERLAGLQAGLKSILPEAQQQSGVMREDGADQRGRERLGLGIAASGEGGAREVGAGAATQAQSPAGEERVAGEGAEVRPAAAPPPEKGEEQKAKEDKANETEEEAEEMASLGSVGHIDEKVDGERIAIAKRHSYRYYGKILEPQEGQEMIDAKRRFISNKMRECAGEGRNNVIIEHNGVKYRIIYCQDDAKGLVDLVERQRIGNDFSPIPDAAIEKNVLVGRIFDQNEDVRCYIPVKETPPPIGQGMSQ